MSGFIVLLLAADFLSNRGDEEPTFRRALVSSAAWIGVSVAFGALLGAIYGSVIAREYFADYLLEKSLSVDNIFVFALLFTSFAVAARLQHRVLNFRPTCNEWRFNLQLRSAGTVDCTHRSKTGSNV